MSTLLLTLLVFLDIVKWLVIISVIISWIGIKIKFIDSILDPTYEFIEKYIPTKIGPVSFTPIILLIGISLLTSLIFLLDPLATSQYYQIIHYIQNV